MDPRTDAYLRRLGRELRALEARLNAAIRTELLRALALIRTTLAALPDDGISRTLQYAALRPQLEAALVPLNDALATLLTTELWLFQTRARELATAYAGTDAGTPPTPPAALMTQLRFLGRTLAAYFQRHSPSAFMREILRIADRTAQRALLDGTPTSELLQQVLPETTRRGQRLYVIRRGTVANAVRARIDALITTSVWSVFTRESRRIWTHDTTIAWQWSAVLDPRTCPVCRPLDAQRRPTPDGFGVTPPVHPHCRCVVIPITIS